MARPSLFTIVLGVLKKLLRMLFTPFYYIISCFVSVIANIRHYIRNLADSHDTNLLDYEKKKLLDAWSTSTSSNVLFVTLEVHLRNFQRTQISEVALSRWSPGIMSRILTMFWTIKNKPYDTEEYHVHRPSLFPHGTTTTIEADEVSSHLEDVFEDFREQYDKIYLVGYRIGQTLSLISTVWEMPKDIATIDTEKIWQLQNHGVTGLSFKQCIETTPQLQGYAASLGNAGNEAWLGIQLLKIELKVFHGGI